MEEELVSVIVPVYNIEDYLPRCLACIEMQTYRNLEIILVDDGSTDDSGRICDEYAAKDSRARVIHHPENRGLWAARNTGQDAATGDYLWLPDGDDYFHKDIIRVMYEAINQMPDSGKKYDVAFVHYKNTSRFDEDVTAEIQPAFVEKTLEEVLEVFVRPTDCFTGRNIWNKLYRKELVNDIRTGNYKYSQDCDFCLKSYLKSPRIILVNQPMYYWVDRNSSARCSQNYSFKSKWYVIMILADNYRSMRSAATCCRRYILEFLYILLAMSLDFVQNTDSLPIVRQKSKEIVKFTWKSYLECKSIDSLKKRIFRVLRIRFDRLYRFVYE